MGENVEFNIPVTILSGFLGAGKTTYLNHLLKSNEGVRYAVIENEFGQEGIDNELIIRPEDTIVELNNGCLCCTLNDNLYDIINELYERRDEIDEIIIEATGVADPTGLAEPFIAHPMIKKHFPLTSIICMVDAELIEDQIQDTEEAINQVTYSDILLLNKIDLVNDDYISYLEEYLRKLNPLATIVRGTKDSYPKIEYQRRNDKLEKLLHDTSHDHHQVITNDGLPFQKPHHHHHHEHTKDVNSISLVFDTPFDFHKLHLRLSVFLSFQSKDLYRMKGLIWLADDQQQFIVQSVGKRLDFQAKEARSTEVGAKSVMVFIGKNLQREGIEKMLKSCLAKTQTTEKDSSVI